MSNQQVTQPKPKPKLAECNICRRAGFPEQMITFVNSGQKKADGKIKWDLLNEDYSIHIHRSPTEKFENIENDKPPARPPLASTEANEQLTQEEIGILKQFVALLKVVK